jgi:hypothetical protein
MFTRFGSSQGKYIIAIKAAVGEPVVRTDGLEALVRSSLGV